MSKDFKKNNPLYKPFNNCKPLEQTQGMKNFNPNEYHDYSEGNPQGKKFATSTPFSKNSDTFKGILGNPSKKKK